MVENVFISMLQLSAPSVVQILHLKLILAKASYKYNLLKIIKIRKKLKLHYFSNNSPKFSFIRKNLFLAIM